MRLIRYLLSPPEPVRFALALLAAILIGYVFWDAFATIAETLFGAVLGALIFLVITAERTS